MGGLDGLLGSNTEALNTLPLEQRAMIPGGLPHALSIDEIASLTYPNNQLKQNALMSLLVEACRAGKLQYYGDMSGWDDFREFMDAPLPNPFPKAKGDLSMIYSPDRMPQLHYDSDIGLIHQDDFKAYLQREKHWPVSGLLANWWPDDKLDAETFGNDDESATREKRLIAKERNTTELLDLIYQMFDAYNIKLGDALSRMTAKEAWGHILAKKYKSDLIKEIVGERKSAYIVLNGGNIVDFETFSRTYNRRFKK